MNEKQIKKTIYFSIILITIGSVIVYLEARTGIPIGNTTIWWILYTFILYAYIAGKKFFYSNSDSDHRIIIVKWYLIWNIICIIRGVFLVETYWDLKGLVSSMFGLVLPVVAYVLTNKTIFQSILISYIRYALPLFLLVSLIISPAAYGFYLVPISFFVFFLPVLPRPWKLVVTGLAILVVLADFGARSNVIKFGVPFLLLSLYFFRSILFYRFPMEVLRKGLMLLPWILFILAINGGFNIFKMDEYIGGNYVTTSINARGEVVEDVLTSDTRTSLYIEVLETAKKYNSWLIGRTPARGSESEVFSSLSEITGRQERLSNEVAILNIFTWTGIAGVILYMMIFYQASYLALNRSNNIFLKMLGIFIAFRWGYAWVEDINNFSLSNFFLWAIIGMCFSRHFRAMSNKEIKIGRAHV